MKMGTKLKEFFKSVAVEGEHVLERTAYNLRATGGTFGAALAEAIYEEWEAHKAGSVAPCPAAPEAPATATGSTGAQH